MADQRPTDPRHNPWHRDATEDDPGRSIVPYGSDTQEHRAGRDPFTVALVWCLLGGAALGFFTLIGCAMVAFGAGAALGGRNGAGVPVSAPRRVLSRQQILWCVLASVGGAAIGAWLGGLGLVFLLEAVVDVALSWVVARLVIRERASAGTGYLIAAVATVAYLVLSSVSALLAGVSPVTAARSMIDAVVSATVSGTSLDVAAQLRSLEGLLLLLWPFYYFVLGGLNVLCAHAGAWLSDLVPGSKQPWRMASFEAPRWSVIVLIVGVALVGVGSLGFLGALGSCLLSAGLCTLMAVRFVFMVQGFGVVTWWLSAHRFGCLVRFLVLFLAVDLEASFLVVSLLGLVDFWANFRKLPRSGRPEGTKA
ncbi:hypothetical protein QJ043_04065 [Olsenella sp. YH-ols2217]|uniref:Membrane protein DUF2232 n=1 Tax=Kribbibacterium absianum TaxID=3044210 RepID=A0ABT6ZL34_9ACTN|nr:MULTISPECIES: hypothetical protein [unclassified Olsenella]MDJ1122764.1 hypothetical protein [Olsenella sp. YH-ols2216]MDJ1129253.1 hypothetical protein [Olsenella sp. YH-ols2217]